ncbi:hypothetical protein CIRG_00478 [Coccidioides immitis RMSCC 2394]|uniref:Uncharacterized protein n=1 Tax=Coccidioides immitis RMSCC 2394 TaxID=404692 RepID=A0A0J6XVW4_COCIT|nr:hypothetical protein CIRG_00478 [Coccidioides immitis RMSCC 2394]
MSSFPVLLLLSLFSRPSISALETNLYRNLSPDPGLFSHSKSPSQCPTAATAGNHYCSRDYGSGAANSSSYHYSNTNGSYYYSNPNGSTYYNSGQGSSTYTSPSGNVSKSSGGK